MTVPTGQVRFSDIGSEFGYTPNSNLGSYRILQEIAGRNWPLDTGIPSSTNQTIKFSDFRGKTCNVVVDYVGGEILSGSGSVPVNFTVSRDASNNNSISLSAGGYPTVSFSLGGNGTVSSPYDIFGNVTYQVTGTGNLQVQNSGATIGLEDAADNDYNDLVVTAKKGTFYQSGGSFYYVYNFSGLETAADVYESNGIVVGGFKSLPSSSETKKVYHVIRRKIGNGLSSGSWDGNTVLLAFIITGSGSIYGKGGNGGQGANLDDNGDDGQSGGNALTVTYNSTVFVEQGGILAGGGGGGGGGGYQYNGGPDARGAGQGGGGGAGYPAGLGGGGGFVNNGGRNGNVCQGNKGNDGTLTTGGTGGPVTCNLTGGNNGGKGGNGGDLGKDGEKGQNKSNGTGGNGGSAGKSVAHPGYTLTLFNSGLVYGSYD